MAERPAEIVDAIVTRVLVPAVTGGALVIERPFGRARAFAAAEVVGGFEISQELATLDREIGARALDRGEDALLRRIRRLAGIDPQAMGRRLDGGVVALAALFHDLVAAFHPDLGGVLRRDAPHRLLDATARALADVPPPSTVRAALLRHAWLGGLPLFSLARVDVRWWVGGASFVGRTPPKRLLLWPDVRRVRRDERTVGLLRLPELFGDREDLAVLTELHARATASFLAATPLTDLALAGRIAPPFTWTDTLAKLVASPTGARLARRAIASGEEGGRFAREVVTQAAGDAARAFLDGAAPDGAPPRDAA